GGFGGFSGGFDFDDLGDIFGSFFGGGQSRASRANAARQGEDKFMSLTIDFLEAAHGVEKEISIMHDEECDVCHGSGAKSKSDIETCSTCGGSGIVNEQVRTPFGISMNQRVCPTCGGKGKTIKHKCEKCHGKGTINKKIVVDLKIPAGINTGQQLRVSGKGHAGINGGPYGDLYVEIRIKKHEYFVREGLDVYLEVPISYSDAALGTKINVPTIHGDVDLIIPEGSQSQTKFRMKNKGIKNLRGTNFGNQYVVIKVVTPTKLSKQEKALLVQLQELEAENGKSFIDRIKSKFK
ncbi:MAG: DnaJ C-terminal domain-containing protein, partial [Bacilli bacterium]